MIKRGQLTINKSPAERPPLASSAPKECELGPLVRRRDNAFTAGHPALITYLRLIVVTSVRDTSIASCAVTCTICMSIVTISYDADETV